MWLAYRRRMDAAGFDAGQSDRVVAAARDMFRFVAEHNDDVMRQAAVA
jgi:heme oxygenase